jgi:hypothetical protein
MDTSIYFSGAGKVSTSGAAVVVGVKRRGSVSVAERAFQPVTSERSDSGVIIKSSGLTVSMSISESISSTAARTDGMWGASEPMVGGPVSVTIGSKSEGKFSKPRRDVVFGLSLPSLVNASEREGSD